MPSSRSWLTAVLMLSVAFVLLSGCSASYTYVISGIVKGAANGKPLQDVEIDVKYNIGSVDKIVPIITRSDGTFRFEWNLLDGSFDGPRMPSLILNLTKTGYSDESVDISPQQKPSSTQIPAPIFVVAYLRSAELDE